MTASRDPSLFSTRNLIVAAAVVAVGLVVAYTAVQRNAPEPAAPEQAASEPAAPEQTTAEQAAPEPAALEQTTAEQAAPEPVAPEQAAPEETTAQQAAPAEAAPAQPAESGSASAEGAAPEGAASSETAATETSPAAPENAAAAAAAAATAAAATEAATTGAATTGAATTEAATSVGTTTLAAPGAPGTTAGAAAPGGEETVQESLRLGEEPDWPCPQRYTPELSSAAIWSGPPIDEAIKTWGNDEPVRALVVDLTSEGIEDAEGVKLIDDFAARAGPDKDKLLTEVFAGVFDSISTRRSSMQRGIKRFVKRQETLVTKLNDLQEKQREMDASGVDTEDPKMADLTKEIYWNTRVYDERSKLTPYICDEPLLLEQRLGAYARAIQAHMSN
ncbi:MAG: hypothetical protein WCF16_09440 [Alphaproteobacteria bacterium]